MFDTIELKIVAQLSERDRKQLDRIEDGVSHNAQILQSIMDILSLPAPNQPDAVGISQINTQGEAVSITGTNVGGNSTFEADALLAGVADPSGFPAGSIDTWTADDPTIGIGPDSGPSNSQVVVSLPATYTKPDYGLSVSVQMPSVAGVAPAPLTLSVRVPAIPAAPPLPTGVAINQVA
jgi:hypothetical protein